ncbi:MAG TPA: hypothetical protein VIK22_08645 [Candidatus Anoxymicrobiaceae bacterium]
MVRSLRAQTAALAIIASLLFVISGCGQNNVRSEVGASHPRTASQSTPARQSRHQVDKVLIPAAEWGGVDVYDNREPHSEPMNYKYGQKWQCVEVVQRLYAQKWGYAPVWPVAYAYQMWAAAPEGLVKHPNGDMNSIPVWGDAIVFEKCRVIRAAGTSPSLWV